LPLVEGPRSTPYVHFVNAVEGWAVYGPLWQRTADGGKTWQKEERDLVLLSPSFSSPTEGWDVSFGQRPGQPTGFHEDVLLKHTLDGGRTWRPVQGKVVSISNVGVLERAEPFRERVLSLVYAWDSRFLWAVGYTDGVRDRDRKWMGAAAYVFLRTEDGGSTWHLRYYGLQVDGVSQAVPASAIIRSAFPPRYIEFVSIPVGFVATQGNGLYRTTDGGETWEHLGRGVFVDFVDTQNGWHAADGIFRTTDGGRTWVLLPEARPAAGSTSLLFLDPREGWAITWGGRRILHTSDGGRTWELE
jgi:photosystem II stability/assembly factor-like uncharacterized protein